MGQIKHLKNRRLRNKDSKNSRLICSKFRHRESRSDTIYRDFEEGTCDSLTNQKISISSVTWKKTATCEKSQVAVFMDAAGVALEADLWVENYFRKSDSIRHLGWDSWHEDCYLNLLNRTQSDNESDTLSDRKFIRSKAIPTVMKITK